MLDQLRAVRRAEHASEERKELVPQRIEPSPDFAVGRRRLGTLSLLSGLFLAVYLVILYVAFPVGRIGFPVAVAVTVLELTIWVFCRKSSLPDERVFNWALVLAIVATWLSAVGAYFEYDARIHSFSIALLNVLCLPFYAVIGRARVIPIAALMAVSQPVVAFVAYEGGFAEGTPRALFGNVVGALFAFGIAAGATELVHVTRRDTARDVGSYALVRKLGQGGMGEVWEGRHRVLMRPAAIKLLSGKGFTPQQEERFEREAQATALLTSEHTVRLFDFGTTHDGRLYYAMELLQGRDFQKLVEQYGALTPAHVVHLMAQVCDSVGEAHEAGLVHRDLKPSNLFLARCGLVDEFVKVLDFGLVTVEGGLLLTQKNPGAFMGTAAYAPPEVLLGHPHSPRSDVYQLGSVMFFLLTGRPVFDEDSFYSTAMAHMSTPPPRPSELARGPVPDDVEELILRCLAKDPTERPSSARVLFLELRALECFGTWTDEDAAEYVDSVLPPPPDEPIATALRRAEARASLSPGV